jgi:hypothetical protein
MGGKLEGKVALITGAASGQGAAMTTLSFTRAPRWSWPTSTSPA